MSGRGYCYLTLLLTAAVACSNPPKVGLLSRTEVTSLTFPVNMPVQSPYKLTPVLGNGVGAGAIGVAYAPDGTNRLFLLQLGPDNGVYVYPSPAATSGTIFFRPEDIVDPILAGTRIKGIAFHPNYTNNGYVYIAYTDGDLRTLVARFTVSADPNQVDLSTGQLLFEIPNPDPSGELFHSGGALTFGPDGMLYVSFGDGGPHHDPHHRGQSLDDLYGNILRVDVDNGVPYAIPPDNPFVGMGGGVKEEIWAYGFRHPWRMSFDRLTGKLWVGDVGQGLWEEVDIVKAGGNYAWAIFEGSLEHDNPDNIPYSTFEPPLYEYPHHPNYGDCVIGGHVYRGAQLPILYGSYVFGDCVSGRVWAMRFDGEEFLSVQEIANVPGIAGFGEDQAGEIYLASYPTGQVYRLELGDESTVPDGAFPTKLSETGIFSDLATLTVSPGLIEFDVAVPLWSDGALKRRWIALPNQEVIEFDATESWKFPAGTVFVKHFELPISEAQTRRLETRVLVHHLQGWAGYTYKWNAAQTDAELLSGSLEETYEVDTAAGGDDGEQTWYYPSGNDCMRCHTQAGGWILGARTRQLNHKFAYPTIANQLATWDYIGLFGESIGDVTDYEAYPDFFDPNASVAKRARAYLASNCAHCHQPGAPAPVDIDFRYGIPLSAMGVADVLPMFGDMGISGGVLLKPGHKELSILWERIRTEGEGRMPPLATSVPDESAIDVLGAWVDDL